ncbi:hypothetical protein BDZ85DRAFT_13480 [Elsinoe ampelina]|uniref:Uncharacterized protein n=1 Tax=Elsinoe ampelina TaxID=302913 RepID=A0A6A6GR52_9PEZI|nr:hypothetical protein BDZ85DRAFT_13480 [Elsinoe ampelina]
MTRAGAKPAFRGSLDNQVPRAISLPVFSLWRFLYALCLLGYRSAASFPRRLFSGTNEQRKIDSGLTAMDQVFRTFSQWLSVLLVRRSDSEQLRMDGS